MYGPPRLIRKRHEPAKLRAVLLPFPGNRGLLGLRELPRERGLLSAEGKIEFAYVEAAGVPVAPACEELLLAPLALAGGANVHQRDERRANLVPPLPVLRVLAGRGRRRADLDDRD